MKTPDRLLETIALDEAHGVEWAAIGILAKAIDRHDTGMFQPAGDLRLQHKTRSATRIFGKALLNLLEGYLSVQFFIEGHVYLTQASLGMGPKSYKSTARDLHGLKGDGWMQSGSTICLGP